MTPDRTADALEVPSFARERLLAEWLDEQDAVAVRPVVGYCEPSTMARRGVRVVAVRKKKR